MGGLSDLDFSPGLDFQRLVSDRFNSPVSFTPSFSSSEFFLVASFGRSAIRLNNESVVLMIQSCLGGIDLDFRVQHLAGTMFRFSVFSKHVGFMIHKLSSFKCRAFDIFFTLWGNGGPNW
ncbi:unnamed protein product [Urochloa humidicola]